MVASRDSMSKGEVLERTFLSSFMSDAQSCNIFASLPMLATLVENCFTFFSLKRNLLLGVRLIHRHHPRFLWGLLLSGLSSSLEFSCLVDFLLGTFLDRAICS